MSDLAIANEPREKPLRFTAEHAKEVGLPTAEAINYMTSVVDLLIYSAAVTRDLVPEAVPGWVRPPNEHSKEAKACFCATCYLRQAVKSNAMLKMLRGWGYGFNALESLDAFSIVKGRLTMGYPYMLRVMTEKELNPRWLSAANDPEEAKLELTLRDGTKWISNFTIEEARRAQLIKDDKEASNWKKYPADMLRARAASRGFRATGLGARIYTPEEALDMEPEAQANGQPKNHVPTYNVKRDVPKEHIDETKIPPEMQSALMDAAGQTGQAWAQQELARIAKEARTELEMKLMVGLAVEQAKWKARHRRPTEGLGNWQVEPIPEETKPPISETEAPAPETMASAGETEPPETETAPEPEPQSVAAKFAGGPAPDLFS